MKTIIAGSRTITDYAAVERAITASGFTITEVVCGLARGVDSIGAQWAHTHGIPVKSFPALWGSYGRRAGFVRNHEMAKYADALILVWDGVSRGSAHMLKTARELGLQVFVQEQ